MSLEIHLFGQFEVINDGEVLRQLNTGRLPALISFLVIHHKKPVQRSRVAYQLWPESNEDQALTNLRKAIHQLRHILPDVNKIMYADKRTLELHGDGHLQADVIEFETALQQADRFQQADALEQEQAALESAVEHYRGELMAGCYDEWILPIREELFQRYLHASERLVTLLEERRCYPEAIARAQTQLNADPLREGTYRQLIRLHALNGDRAAALSVYHTCVTRLQQELEVDPEPQTQEVYERLLRGPVFAAQPAQPVKYPLVGREEEWKQLVGAWHAAQAGLARLLVLEGEAGIGKTRLAEDLLEWARKQGTSTGTAVCYAAEGQTSYVPVATWLRSQPLPELETVWKREVSRVLPELLEAEVRVAPPEPISQGWQRQVFFDALKRALLGKGEQRLLFLDNLQWCDRDTLDWLQYLLGSPMQARLLVLAGLRSGEITPDDPQHNFLLAMQQSGRLIEMELPRLNERRTAELGARVLKHELDEGEARRLYAQTEGVPLFVVEMARSGLKVQNNLRWEAGKSSPEPLTPQVRAVLEWRLGRLSSPARALAQSAAVIGREFDVSLVEAVSDLGEATTVTALDELWQRRIIRQRGVDYDFSHDRLRDVALLDTGPVRLRWLHQRAAETLENRTDEQRIDLNARIAYHYEQAGHPKKAAAYFWQAAQHVRRLYALQDTLAYLEHSLALDPQSPDLADLQEDRGDVYALLDQREKAYQAFEAALEQAPVDDWLRRSRVNRKILDTFGRYDPELSSRAYQSALAALTQAKDYSDAYWDAWLELQLAWMLFAYWRVNYSEMSRLNNLLADPMQTHGTTIQQIKYKGLIITCNFLRDRFFTDDETIELARQTVALAKKLNSPYELADAWFHLAMLTYNRGLLQEGEEAFVECKRIAEQFGFQEFRMRCYVHSALNYRRMGRVDAVREETEKLAQLLSQVSRMSIYEAIMLSNRAWLSYRAGDHSRARHLVQAAIDTWSEGNVHKSFNQWPILSIQFAMAIEDRNPFQAVDPARRLVSPDEVRLIPEVEVSLKASLEAFELLDPQVQNTPLALDLFQPALEALRTAGYV